MAYEFSNYAVKVTLVAGEDLSAKQYHFVKIDNGTGKAVAVSGATDRPIGVVQNNPTSGQEAEVLISGGTKIKAGGSASAGQALFASAGARCSGPTRFLKFVQKKNIITGLKEDRQHSAGHVWHMSRSHTLFGFGGRCNRGPR